MFIRKSTYEQLLDKAGAGQLLTDVFAVLVDHAADGYAREVTGQRLQGLPSWEFALPSDQAAAGDFAVAFLNVIDNSRELDHQAQLTAAESRLLAAIAECDREQAAKAQADADEARAEATALADKLGDLLDPPVTTTEIAADTKDPAAERARMIRDSFAGETKDAAVAHIVALDAICSEVIRERNTLRRGLYARDRLVDQLRETIKRLAGESLAETSPEAPISD